MFEKFTVTDNPEQKLKDEMSNALNSSNESHRPGKIASRDDLSMFIPDFNEVA